MTDAERTIGDLGPATQEGALTGVVRILMEYGAANAQKLPTAPDLLRRAIELYATTRPYAVTADDLAPLFVSGDLDRSTLSAAAQVLLDEWSDFVAETERAVRDSRTDQALQYLIQLTTSLQTRLDNAMIDIAKLQKVVKNRG